MYRPNRTAAATRGPTPGQGVRRRCDAGQQGRPDQGDRERPDGDRPDALAEDRDREERGGHGIERRDEPRHGRATQGDGDVDRER